MFFSQLEITPKRMFQKGVLFATLVILEVVYSFPAEKVEEVIEPVELFHRCIDPKKDENEPDKSPVLLLHALLNTHKQYDEIDQLISDRTKRKVCSVDLRNHGDSPWSNRTDIAAFTADVGHFLNAQNIKKANLIGASLGGKIAIHYALNNPDRVDSVVIEDIRPNNVKKTSFLFLKFFVRLLQRIMESQPSGMTENEAKEWAVQESKKLFDQDISNELTPVMWRHSQANVKPMVASFTNFPFKGFFIMQPYQKLPDDISKYLDIRQVKGKWQLKHNMDLLYEKIDKTKEIYTESTGLYTGPTLFIYGTESIFKVGEDEEDILKLFPNAKLVPIKGAGHLIHEFYREFDDIVVNFLNEIN